MSGIVARKLHGDAREALKDVASGSCHVSVTSPPYWRLREYLPKAHPLKHLEIGTENTFDLYLDHLVEVFREVHRVLRDDGTLWLNLGDRYTNAGRSTYDIKAKMPSQKDVPHPTAGMKRPADLPGLKAKELCLVPQRVAMRLQQEGWYLRAMIPWIKRNCMPESVKDRPVTALEYFFMLTKSKDCYYDRDAVGISASANTHPRAAVFPSRQNRISDDNRRRRRINPKAAMEAIGSKQNPSFSDACSEYLPTKRNRRNTDWFMESWEGMLTNEEGDPLALIVNPKGTTIAHFASYPPALVKPCILASTSERGCCPVCGASAVRIIEQGEADIEHQRACGGDMFGSYDGQARKDYNGAKVQDASDVKRRILAGMVERKTVGWKFPCKCTPEGGSLTPVPCTVIDPFHGTGATAEAALGLGRAYVGCDINETYIKVSDIRDSQSALAIL